VRSAVGQVSRLLLEDQVESCLLTAATDGAADDEWEDPKEGLQSVLVKLAPASLWHQGVQVAEKSAQGRKNGLSWPKNAIHAGISRSVPITQKGYPF